MKKTTFIILTTIGLPLMASTPDTIILDGKKLSVTKAEISSGSSRYDKALKALIDEADKYLKDKITTVMDKQLTPPSGDKHDWLSCGIYWWPDPAKPDGKPYIHKDGQTNPQTSDMSTDGGTSRLMFRATLPLALAYWYTGEKKYAKKAAAIIRAWYLDPATAMNPHLDYGEGIPGRTNGRPTGIISFSMRMHFILDAIRILETSSAWTSQDSEEMKNWLIRYCAWLENSPLAKAARFSENNHATWFAAQLALIKVYLGNNEAARQVLEEGAGRMLEIQFDADGKQPQEMARTRSLDYTMMNLNGWLNMVRLGQLTGFDLWNYSTTNGVSLKRGTTFLLPYASGQEKWPYKQIVKINRQTLLELLMRISLLTDSTGFDEKTKTDMLASPAILKFSVF